MPSPHAGFDDLVCGSASVARFFALLVKEPSKYNLLVDPLNWGESIRRLLRWMGRACLRLIKPVADRLHRPE